jgi:hypothetical protein
MHLCAALFGWGIKLGLGSKNAVTKALRWAFFKNFCFGFGFTGTRWRVFLFLGHGEAMK